MKLEAASLSPSNDELDHLIQNFIDNQQADADHCPAQLLEAKHQLNTLHTTTVDIAWEVNNTEIGMQVTMKEITLLQLKVKDLEDECEDKFDKCDEDWKEIYEMWLILKWELKEMYMIANPSVYMASSDIYAASSRSVGASSTSGTFSSSGTSG